MSEIRVTDKDGNLEAGLIAKGYTTGRVGNSSYLITCDDEEVLIEIDRQIRVLLALKQRKP